MTMEVSTTILLACTLFTIAEAANGSTSDYVGDQYMVCPSFL